MTTDTTPPVEPTPDAGPKPRKPMPLHTKILLGLLVGAVLGLMANYLAHWSRMNSPPPVPGEEDQVVYLHDRVNWVAANVADPIGKVFLRLVLMVVIPLVFSALSLGVLELGDVRSLGRVGLRTLGLTLVLSVSAVGIGLLLVNTVRPGGGLDEAQSEMLRAKFASEAADKLARADEAKTLKDTLLDIIPENPFQEMVGAIDGSSKGNGMLAVMFFALVFGIALTLAPPRKSVLVQWLEGLFDVSMVIIGFAMAIAPFAVACLIFSITAQMGIGILTTLFWFVATVLVGMLFQLVVVYSFMLITFARRNPWEFFRGASDAMLTAFGTSSSNATLPTALRVAKEDLRMPPHISQFVLTIGATGNQNGTALFEGVVVLFLAQVFGKDLTIAQQVQVVLMSVLAGVGTAGVPGGSIPLIAIVARSVGVPAEGIAIILGVDRILDMCRTVLNVTGDLVLAACVAGGEHHTESPPEVAPQAAEP